MNLFLVSIGLLVSCCCLITIAYKLDASFPSASRLHSLASACCSAPFTIHPLARSAVHGSSSYQPQSRITGDSAVISFVFPTTSRSAVGNRIGIIASSLALQHSIASLARIFLHGAIGSAREGSSESFSDNTLTRI